MSILENPSLSAKHNEAVQALMSIFKYLGNKSEEYVKVIFPIFFRLIGTSEEGFQDFMFQQLGILVKIIGRGVSDCLSTLMQLVLKKWENKFLRNSLIILVEELCIALGDAFHKYLPQLIPKFVKTINTDTNNKTCILQILNFFQVLGNSVSPFLLIIIPPLSRLLSPSPSTSTTAPLDLQCAALKTFSILSYHVDLSPHLSRCIRPILSKIFLTR